MVYNLTCISLSVGAVIATENVEYIKFAHKVRSLVASWPTCRTLVANKEIFNTSKIKENKSLLDILNCDKLSVHTFAFIKDDAEIH